MSAVLEPIALQPVREHISGGIRVRKNVINKVIREASASVIGVPRGEVGIDLTEWGNGLTVRIAAKLPIPHLEDTAVIRSEPSILDRARSLQTALAAEFARLTGRDIRRVTLTITGAIAPTRRRVR